jgi:hypothetical protein
MMPPKIAAGNKHLARYRCMNKLVSDFGRGLNMSGTAVGVGCRF